MGKLLRIDSVVLIFTTMNMIEVKRVSEHKFDSRIKAGICQPVPVEGAFAYYGEVMAVGFNPFEEVIEVVAFDAMLIKRIGEVAAGIAAVVS